jgi:hypothetical protein
MVNYKGRAIPSKLSPDLGHWLWTTMVALSPDPELASKCCPGSAPSQEVTRDVQYQRTASTEATLILNPYFYSKYFRAGPHFFAPYYSDR